MRFAIPVLALVVSLAAGVAAAQQPRAATPTAGAANNPFLASRGLVLGDSNERIREVLDRRAGEERLSYAVLLYLTFEALNTRVRAQWCNRHGVDLRYYGAVFRKAYEPYTALAALRLRELNLDEADARAKVLPMAERRIDADMARMQARSGLGAAALCEAFNDQADVAIETLQPPPRVLAALQE